MVKKDMKSRGVEISYQMSVFGVGIAWILLSLPFLKYCESSDEWVYRYLHLCGFVYI